jgi:hypothetical protein
MEITHQLIMEHGETEAARVAAARELLDRGYGRPAGSGMQVNVSSTGQQGIKVVCDERTRAELIEQRERLLAGSKAPPKVLQLHASAPKACSDTHANTEAPEAEGLRHSGIAS